jgi:hypothetical protein
MPLIRAPLATFLECWWRKLAKNQRSLPAFFWGPKRMCMTLCMFFWLAWIMNHMHGPMQNFLVCFGAPKLYAFPICKCYAFLNILLGYPLCLTTTHKYIILILILYKYIGFRYNYILIDMESPFLHGPFSSFFQDYHPFTIRGMDFQAESYSNQTWTWNITTDLVSVGNQFDPSVWQL